VISNIIQPNNIYGHELNTHKHKATHIETSLNPSKGMPFWRQYSINKLYNCSGASGDHLVAGLNSILFRSCQGREINYYTELLSITTESIDERNKFGTILLW